MQVHDAEARDWYAKEAAEQTWSVRTLQRNISSQYYYRLLQSQNKEWVEAEMKTLTARYNDDKLEFIKNPVVAEFLCMSTNDSYTESELEKNIISNLQKFLMELGKGYAFVARQQHVHTEKQDYYHVICQEIIRHYRLIFCFRILIVNHMKIHKGMLMRQMV